jgi:hypothetical protein
MNGAEGGDPVATIMAWATNPALIGAVLRALLYLVIGVVVARATRYAIKRGLGGFPVAQQQLFARVAYYGILGCSRSRRCASSASTSPSCSAPPAS